MESTEGSPKLNLQPPTAWHSLLHPRLRQGTHQVGFLLERETSKKEKGGIKKEFDTKTEKGVSGGGEGGNAVAQVLFNTKLTITTTAAATGRPLSH